LLPGIATTVANARNDGKRGGLATHIKTPDLQ